MTGAWARTGGCERVEGRRVLTFRIHPVFSSSVSSSFAPLFYSLSGTAGAFRVADGRRSYMWIFLHTQACTHSSALQWSLCCLFSTLDSAAHTWSNCCTRTRTHSLSVCSNHSMAAPWQLSSRSLFLQKTDKSCFLFPCHLSQLLSFFFFFSLSSEVCGRWQDGCVCVCLIVCVNMCLCVCIHAGDHHFMSAQMCGWWRLSHEAVYWLNHHLCCCWKSWAAAVRQLNTERISSKWADVHQNWVNRRIWAFPSIKKL